MACSPALALLCKRPVLAKPPILNPALAPSSSPFLSQVQHSWCRASTGSNPASLLLTASREGSNPRKESRKVFSFSAGNLTSRLLLCHCVSLSFTHCKHEWQWSLCNFFILVICSCGQFFYSHMPFNIPFLFILPQGVHKLLLLGAEGILSGIPSPTELLLTTPFLLGLFTMV